MEIKLPYGIEIATAARVGKEGGVVILRSGLADELLDEGMSELERARVQGFIDGTESLLMALAGAGIDLRRPEVTKALVDAVEAANNKLG
ncbi:hypothetical protein D3C71_19120 [compost metagenome]